MTVLLSQWKFISAFKSLFSFGHFAEELHNAMIIIYFFYFIHVQYNKMTVKWHVLKSVLLEYKCLRHKDMSVLPIKVVSTEIYFICVQYNKMTVVIV